MKKACQTRLVSLPLVLCVTVSMMSQAMAATEKPTMTLLKAEDIPTVCQTTLDQFKSKFLAVATLPPAKASDSKKVLLEWNQLAAQIEDFSSPLDVLSNVSPNPVLRKNAEACLIKASQFQTELYQNEKLYQRIKVIQPKDSVDIKLQQDLLRMFEDKGVALAPEKRQRMKEILDQLTQMSQDFARNIRDNPEKLEFTPDELKGLPASYIANLKKNNKGNYLLGFEYPEYRPFMELAESDDARKRYQIAFTRRGTAENLTLLKQAMDLRYELAQLYGLNSYADWVTRHRMAKTADAVNGFLDQVKNKVTTLEQQEVASLRQFQADSLKIPFEKAEINRWNETYWSEKLRQQKYDVDQEKLRDYFPTLAAQQWLFSISSQLYGIDFKPVQVDTWHSDVQYFEVLDHKTQQVLGGLYIDLYPREGKYGHAAVWSVRGSSTLLNRLPVSVLVTNFNRKGLNTDELETFVHEFGHALHGILSKTKYVTQAGTSVEQDFVEAPSQMFEEWARRQESLSLLANFCNPACPKVDETLIKKLKAVHNYGRGLKYARQTLYAQYDMTLHGANALQEQPLAVWQKMEGETTLGYVPTSEFPGEFNHLMSGYEAGYYGYMWSEVIALDMLSAFGDNLLNPEIGQRYKNKILSQGSQKPASEMVKEFLGREPNSNAFFDEISGQRVR